MTVLLGASPILSATEAKGPMELFLLAGQSNMAGRGSLKELSPGERRPDARVLVFNRAGEWIPALDPLHWDKPGAGVGPGLFFARIVAAEEPDSMIGLIPTACGSYPIAAWEPGAYWEQTHSHPWDDAMNRAKRAMRDGKLKAILWNQGEGDANAGNAPFYEERLVGLIKRFRDALDAPEVPFIIGQIGDFTAEGRAWNEYQRQIDCIHRAVAARLPHVWYVSSEGLVSRGDRLHFSTDSQRILGKRYAEAYLREMSNHGADSR